MTGVEFSRIDGRYLRQGEQALPLWLAHQRETAFDQGTVFAGKGSYVHHGANGNQVQPLV